MAKGPRNRGESEARQEIKNLSCLLIGLLLEIDDGSPAKVFLVSMFNFHQSTRLQERHAVLGLRYKRLQLQLEQREREREREREGRRMENVKCEIETTVEESGN